MPKLSVWLVRAALIHMAVGFLFGSQVLHHKGIPIYVWTWRLLDPHIELMVFGWTMQFVLGMGYWILPRFSGEHRHGATRVGWCGFALFNAGVTLGATGGWFDANEVTFAARALLLAGSACFVIVLWPRVKPLGGTAAAPRSQV